MVHGLSCSMAHGIFPVHELIERVYPLLARGFFTTEPPGKPSNVFLKVCVHMCIYACVLEMQEK